MDHGRLRWAIFSFSCWAQFDFDRRQRCKACGVVTDARLMPYKCHTTSRCFIFLISIPLLIELIIILEYFEGGKLCCKSQPAARLTHGETRSRHSKAGVRFHTGREPPFHKVFVGILLYHCFFVCFVFASQGFHVFNSEKCQNWHTMP